MRQKKPPVPRPSKRIHEPPPQELTGKLPEIAGCPDCKASYREGRWTWKTPPAGAYTHRCPACERIANRYPAGVLRLEGAFVAAHRDELIGLIQNVEERESADHPLKRIMEIRDEDSGVTISVTDAKLAEAFGRAIHRAYEGHLEHPPTTTDRENLVRLRWARD